MQIKMSYKEVLDLCFPRPPRDTYNILERVRENYPCEVFKIGDMAYLTLVKINRGFYGISWVCVKPDVQNHGYGTQMLCQVFRKYKGVFITKTTSAQNFFIRNGFRCVYQDDDGWILCYVNDKKMVDF